ncbi:hypothetical protein [Burkholderia ubonensis]|uniref:hypothetical protein n=1 Tax=Burkholderia ubonensis TaxID=101571 RepID=UPI002FC8EF80
MTYINGVRRGAFRLHPVGPQRRSEGCIEPYKPCAVQATERLLTTLVCIPEPTQA